MNQMLVHGGGEEDFTRDRSDFKDAAVIANRIAELRCYMPYPMKGQRRRLRHWPLMSVSVASLLVCRGSDCSRHRLSRYLRTMS